MNLYSSSNDRSLILAMLFKHVCRSVTVAMGSVEVEALEEDETTSSGCEEVEWVHAVDTTVGRIVMQYDANLCSSSNDSGNVIQTCSLQCFQGHGVCTSWSKWGGWDIKQWLWRGLRSCCSWCNSGKSRDYCEVWGLLVEVSICASKLRHVHIAKQAG